ncbi:MAG: peptidoglycan DD-metalloendopeptidase family protein [Bacteroidales bacterium]|jgi:septal ring factor EnvC (AmiA/AmiB activator)|nr:peptidoglycan DD-metalloendopeptidase family protein [Bacteroidales bacterium]MDD2686869.1 peptidoglycan DD-metalloendopeptidase family protein [Bacteroidales bacterium]MDD3329786.1 peptidoglycan DD-metalloendopeptidase family protein [Bacteroidales bacterium]MDD3690603.1 peptidoglycan DD-metalloendopeptidase family protein [Bacteroidales bacterium]MDD4044031.1 peptidoglycan DD-metalloendopeptidase family protein [Bacteroidales bacterium]
MYKNIKQIVYFILVVCLSLGSSHTLWSQTSKEALTKEKKQLEKELAQQKKLLEETRRNKTASLREIQLITNQIKNREKLIQTINEELSYIDVEIEEVTKEITQLQTKLDELIDAYRKAIYIAYKHRNMLDKANFIISSENIHQAVKRMRYLQEYSNALNRHVLIIQQTQATKKEKEKVLMQNKQEKMNLLEHKNQEKTNLVKQQRDKDQVVSTLKKKESQINTEINRKIKRQKAIDNQIAKIIEAELAKAKKSVSPKVEAANVALSADFANNQGKLPWPVDKGNIITNFGTYSHPEVSSVLITNNGINILTDRAASVRSIFNGKVSTVSIIDGANVVIISHGAYLTVYSNLGSVCVKPGDVVSTRQVIGNMKSDPNDSKAELHFEIRKERTPLNPTSWIKQ